MNNLRKEPSKSGSKLLSDLIIKSWSDPEFKKKLVSNPERTIENFTGFKLKPEFSMEIVVVDQTDPNTIYFNIPQLKEDRELSENELEIIVGGGPGKDFGIWLANKIEDGIDWLKSIEPLDTPYYSPTYT